MVIFQKNRTTPPPAHTHTKLKWFVLAMESTLKIVWQLLSIISLICYSKDSNLPVCIRAAVCLTLMSLRSFTVCNTNMYSRHVRFKQRPRDFAGKIWKLDFSTLYLFVHAHLPVFNCPD